MSLFDIESKKEELKKLEEQTQQESFWQQDTSISSKVLAKIKELKHKIDEFELAQNEASNLIELTELANLEVDEEVAKDILKSTIYYGFLSCYLPAGGVFRLSGRRFATH